ncbi:hypothetical protein LCGC14_2421470, partial [marine sediment metagenome]
EPERFSSIGALEASIGQDIFEKEGLEGFFEFQAQSGAAKRAKVTPKTPKTPTITPLQRKGLVDKRLEERQKDILGRADAEDIEGLRDLSQEGLSREVAQDTPFLPDLELFGTRPDPDLTASNLLKEFEQTQSPEARQAINDSIQRGLLFPELGIAGGQDRQVSPTPGGQQLTPRLGGATPLIPVWQDWGFNSKEEATADLEASFRAGDISQVQYEQFLKMLGVR